MVAVLAYDGLVEVARRTGDGNRRGLRLTATGAELVERCGRILEERFEGLVVPSGVPYKSYHRHSRLLLDQLDADQERSLEIQDTA
jgi:hypothetical protein